jgi:hypothetical protein
MLHGETQRQTLLMVVDTVSDIHSKSLAHHVVEEV